MMNTPMSPAEVDAEILRLTALLEERVEDFGNASRRAAEAEARYKFRSAQELISLIDNARPGHKTTVQEREARVEVAIADEHAAHLITNATAKSVRESLGALRVQIDALRTVAANYRALTN